MEYVRITYGMQKGKEVAEAFIDLAMTKDAADELIDHNGDRLARFEVLRLLECAARLQGYWLCSLKKFERLDKETGGQARRMPIPETPADIDEAEADTESEEALLVFPLCEHTEWKPNWKRVRCPRCGRTCWLRPASRELLKEKPELVWSCEVCAGKAK